MKSNIKYDLWKLGFLSAERIPKEEIEGFDKDQLPENIISKDRLGEAEYFRIENDEIDPEELELFLKVKNARGINTIRRAVVVCAVCLCIAVLPYVLAVLSEILS